MAIDKVLYADIVNQETDGANAAALCNDTKRAINEMVDEVEEYISNTETTIEEEFTNVAGESTFAFTYTPNFVDFYYNGSKLAEADVVATDGITFTLESAVSLDTDIITGKAFRSFSAGDGITQADADGRYLKKSSNLAELVSPAAARTNLGLGTASLADINASGDVWGASNIEYGSNSNGEYWKYPDGKLICTERQGQGSQSFTAASGSGVGFSPVFTWTFPHAFVSINPVISASGADQAGGILWASAATPTLLSVAYRAVSTDAGSIQTSVDLIAIGSWK